MIDLPEVISHFTSITGFTIAMPLTIATYYQSFKTRQEARDARVVQESLIPDRYPDLPGYEFWHHYQPAHLVQNFSAFFRVAGRGLLSCDSTNASTGCLFRMCSKKRSSAWMAWPAAT